jgi:superfamily II DNA/RNA helicase
MVRRIKEDIREIQGGFPRRDIIRLEIADLPDDAPELELSRLLDEYRAAREERFAQSSSRAQAAAGLLVVGLQQRLLSSIEAFARSLAVHRATVVRQRERAAAQEAAQPPQPELLLGAPGPDDERGEWTDEELETGESEAIEQATAASEAGAPADAAAWEREQRLLDRMEEIAERSRHQPDVKIRRLVDWIRENLCAGLPPLGEVIRGEPPHWNNRRVLIFTENREGTKRYLRQILEQAIDGTDRAQERIAVITGLTSGEARKEIQRRFNADPADDPLRILIATDAAREGLNFQAHCADLFHFDLPWNPGRIEQRNGRIDRKLQPADTVRCHYFVLSQRAEDRVLEVLVRKTETIKRELGSLSKVIDDDVERRLNRGIRHRDAERLAAEIEAADLDAQRKQIAAEELEAARERQDELREQIERCRTLLERSRSWVDFDAARFRHALSRSLELLGTDPLQQESDGVWRLPPLERRAAADPSWQATLDTLRAPRRSGQKLTDWRREAPVRPVVFEDQGVMTEEVVHLHLEQRVAQRLLARFRAQGFVHHDLSRACVTQVADSIPRVVLLGRLSLYGARAERLHEQLVPVAARWIEPDRRDGPLTVYAREAEARSLELLDAALAHPTPRQPAEQITRRLLESASRDVEELLTQLEAYALDVAGEAERRLRERGERERRDLRETLERQRSRVREELARHREDFKQLTLDFDADDRRQLEANMRSWERRLEQFDSELETEPDRVAAFYEVRARRVEPVGLVYLWPDTN